MPDYEVMIGSIERFLDGVEREDVDAAVAAVEDFVHPEMEFTSVIGFAVDGRTYVGTNGLREWFKEFSDTFEVRFSNRLFRDLGNCGILGLFTLTMKGRGSGAEIVREIGTVWELEDGVVVKCATHPSQAEAQKAAEALVSRSEAKASRDADA